VKAYNNKDNSNSFSDRIFKSSEPWSDPYFNEIVKLEWRDDYNPKYVEVTSPILVTLNVHTVVLIIPQSGLKK
jgi:hypothetical protein